MVAGCTPPCVRLSQMMSGTKSRNSSSRMMVKAGRIGGAIGSRPMDGPAMARIAAPSIARLCHCAFRRWVQPDQIMTAKGTIWGVAGAAFLIVGIVVKARLEESFLRGELGTAYDDYARRVPMLVPFAPN